MIIRITKEDFALIPFTFFWLLIFFPKPIQLFLLATYFLTLVLYYGISISNDLFFELQAIYLGIYGVSIIFNCFAEPHETSRIIATINTWLVNCISLGVYSTFKKNVSVNSEKLSKTCLFNLAVLIVLAVLFLTYPGIKNLSIMGHAIYGGDWLNGDYSERFLGFFDYSNMVVFAVLFFYSVSFKTISNSFILTTLLTTGAAIAIYVSHSRSGLILFLVIVILQIVTVKEKVLEFIKKNKMLIVGITAILVLIFGILNFQTLQNWVNGMIQIRSGSSEMRVQIYRLSIQRMLDRNPIIGMGIKDMLGNSGFPYGSHSTYIGAFYKTGLVGGTIYTISIVWVFVQVLRANNANNTDFISKVSILSILILMIFEDIDGTNWAEVIFYILMSQIVGR